MMAGIIAIPAAARYLAARYSVMYQGVVTVPPPVQLLRAIPPPLQKSLGAEVPPTHVPPGALEPPVHVPAALLKPAVQSPAALVLPAKQVKVALGPATQACPYVIALMSSSVGFSYWITLIGTHPVHRR